MIDVVQHIEAIHRDVGRATIPAVIRTADGL